MEQGRKTIKMSAIDHQVVKIMSAKTGMSQTALLSYAMKFLASQFPELYTDFPHGYPEKPHLYHSEVDDG